MTRDEFWQHIDSARQREASSVEAGLRAELSDLDPAGIENFQRHFDQLFDQAYRWDLWGAAYLIGGGCSDDGFTDFRYGLIGLGREIFERALANPDSLSRLDGEIENEELGYVASSLFEKRAGKPMSTRYADAPAEPAGDDWDFDDPEEMMKRFPALWKRLGQGAV